ncbi:hypothetical protein AXF42_Ash005985 [Apostasia shenzhenica]|uniref:Protein transport protein sec16 n=1 Tax=Apostasia shenzhenica TaxID=1088818 RepID=A0A2I0AZX9_9ASPA|nr:hypothetical protein AXF42_Ash005985 [Apostasia shenzhenica]
MASPAPFQLEDQTDEDFFDRLVEDDFGVTGSIEGSARKDWPLSITVSKKAEERTAVEDSEDSGFAAEEDELENRTTQASPAPSEEAVITSGSTLVESSDPFVVSGTAEYVVSEEKSDFGPEVKIGEPLEIKSGVGSLDSLFGRTGESMNAGVKEVQWSTFSVDSLSFSSGGLEPFSDFLTENLDVSANKANVNVNINQTASDQDVNQSSSNPGYEQTTNIDNSTYWENLYPGWKFDATTGQWYQIVGHDATTNSQNNYYASSDHTQETFQDDEQGHATGLVLKNTQVAYSQQYSSTMIEAAADDCSSTTLSSWNQNSQEGNVYPPNMVFDPQYPGWYYDTNTQQWYTLDSYTQSIQQTDIIKRQERKGTNYCNGFIGEQSLSFYSQDQVQSLDVLTNSFAQQSIQHPDAHDYSKSSFSGDQQTTNFSAANKVHEMNCSSQQVGFSSWDTTSSCGYIKDKSSSGFQNFIPAEGMLQFSQSKAEQNLQSSFSQSFYADQKLNNYHEHQLYATNTSYPHFSYANNDGRSSAGRPPHALVSFGFGGKLVIMKVSDISGMRMNYHNQESTTAAISILNLMEVVKDEAHTVGDYFHSLCRQSFPGPLVGGSASVKDVYKWINERITDCESPVMDHKKGELLKLLLSLLKISCQHYGKLRSPFGSDTLSEEGDAPESAVTKLFAGAGANGSHAGEINSFSHCMHSIPSEGQIQATAVEMQHLLVSGKRKEALHVAQVGQLWGPALVLATQLGDKFYIDTVKQMAQRLFLCGSPLRTLCLLIAGQPADIFSVESSYSSFSGTTKGNELPALIQSSCMLGDWQKNLAIIIANRTKDDELVVTHLGDCLWKERVEVTAAHTCYLVAETNFEPYSDSARLCLLGADHWKYPRTYACPDAIQRTELYEYSKVLGNSQFVLLPFQPYKLIYASMLAEVGKISDSLRYCQAAMKLLRNSGRTPEVEMWKALLASLEERLRSHMQGGYSENFAPTKLVGKLFTSIDHSIHRMMGTQSPLPPMPENSASGKESHIVAPKVLNSQSTMAMSSLMPSPSVDGMSEWTGEGGRKGFHGRSISEPDFGRTPKLDLPNGSSAIDAQNKTSPSRIGILGSQFLQKTMGWVSRTRSDRQAKLGERNKFYYDEKLKRWIEEGVEAPAEEAVLLPPPKTASFQNGAADFNISNAMMSHNPIANGGSESKSPNLTVKNSGIPPMAPISNQFSAHGKMGVRSRYVDTFNKDSGSLQSSFQSPSAPVITPPAAKFFVPMVPSPSNEQAVIASGGIKEPGANGDSCTSMGSQPFFSSLQQFPRMDTIEPYQNTNGFLPYSRAASWNGSFDASNATMTEVKPQQNGFASPSSLNPSNQVIMRLNSSPELLNAFNDDLHEVDFR